MILQIGEITINKTKKFLTPCIKVYGLKFEKYISDYIFKIGYGIGDIITVKSGVRFEKHLFILVDTVKSAKFNQFLGWIKDQVMYENDYVFDDIQDGSLHMIVIKFPEQYYKTYDTFKASQFSKMYTADEVKAFFNRPETVDIQRILIKDHNYKIDFVKSLNKLYGASVKPEEFDGELEMPVRREEEEFNTHLLKEQS